jgi:acetyl esterase/lipase
MPIMAWAHPTVGIADRCAPSTSGPGFTPFDVGRPLEAGWAVIATDFEGLGGPGLHPYLVGEAEARAIFDLARAVREMDSGVGSTLLLWGFSHGGHAVLAAGGLADDLGPEFDIAGIAGVAPTVDLIGWASTAIGTIEQAHIVGIVMALAATYELDVTEVLTPAAIEILDEAEASCSDPTFSTIAGMSGSSVFAADPATIDPWAGLLIDNSPELHPIEAPVLLVVGSEDRLWDVDDLDLIVDRMCGVGTPVATSIHLGEDHESIVAAAIATVTSFLQERLAGEPFETDC